MNYKLRKMQKDKWNHLSSLELGGETIRRAGEKVDGVFPIISVPAGQGHSWVPKFLFPLTLGQVRNQMKSLLQAKDLKLGEIKKKIMSL